MAIKDPIKTDSIWRQNPAGEAGLIIIWTADRLSWTVTVNGGELKSAPNHIVCLIFGIFDLSTYYPDQAVSVMRGFKLLAPKAVLLRDELVLKSGTKEVSWRFITRAKVQINGNTAILSQNGKKFYLRCLLPGGFELKVFPAAPYSQQEKPIIGVNIVEITMNVSDKPLSIPVLLSNKTGGLENNSEVNLQLKDWN